MEEIQFLLKIKKALARYSTEEEKEVAASGIRPVAEPPMTPENRIRWFLAEVKELNGVSLIRVPTWEKAREAIAQDLMERKVSSIAVAGKDLQPENRIWKKWGPAQGRVPVQKAQVGVVQADYGVAETGSVVLLASPEKPRIVSLLPPVCYFALPVPGLLDSMPQLMEELQSRHERGEMPSTVNVVTGPSRTADIELSLTVGVHGPGEVKVFLVG